MKVRKELPRQLFHLVNGIIIALAYVRWEREVGVILIFLSFAGLYLSYRYIKSPLHRVEPLLKLLDRDWDRRNLPAKGAIFYGFAVGFSLLIFSHDAAIASVTTLAAGDAFSTLVGLSIGRRSIPWNKKLSLEGSFGFMLASLILSSFFLPFQMVLVASLCGALVETIPWPIDDNISIPLCVGGVLQVLFY